MADQPDKAPVEKPYDEDDEAWPNTMRHFKWEKKPDQPAQPPQPPPAEEPQADGDDS
jgi:hypothetical protein